LTRFLRHLTRFLRPNGEVAATCDLLTPMSSASKVRVGFASHKTEMSVKDVYLVAK
jgi:hypothetical protein